MPGLSVRLQRVHKLLGQYPEHFNGIVGILSVVPGRAQNSIGRHRASLENKLDEMKCVVDFQRRLPSRAPPLVGTCIN